MQMALYWILPMMSKTVVLATSTKNMKGNTRRSDASSREEGQEWEVDSFDDGFDYRPRRNLDPNDEIGQKMHRYRSSMYKSKVCFMINVS